MKRVLSISISIIILLLLFSPGQTTSGVQAAPSVTTKIAVITDYGTCDSIEQSVANLVNNTLQPTAIVTGGDNWQSVSGCTAYSGCVGNYYSSFASAHTFYPTLGNHDYDAGLSTYNGYFTWLPTSPDSQRRWYDVILGDVHFFFIDGNNPSNTSMRSWLQSGLGASTSVWNIVVIHQAPYSTGFYHDISASQMPYGTWGADFVISGHNHHFERLLKADGGFNVRYFVAGYGGNVSHSSCSGTGSAATSESCVTGTPGAMLITASETEITLAYYNTSGSVRSTYTQQAPSAVTVSYLEATAQGHTIQVDWETYSEVDIASFNLYRSTAANGAGRARIYSTPASYPGEMTGSSYQFSDTDVQSYLTYYYWLEVVKRDGSTEFMDPTPASLYSIRLFLPAVHR
jgi:hypothetical protein